MNSPRLRPTAGERIAPGQIDSDLSAIATVARSSGQPASGEPQGNPDEIGLSWLVTPSNKQKLPPCVVNNQPPRPRGGGVGKDSAETATKKPGDIEARGPMPPGGLSALRKTTAARASQRRFERPVARRLPRAWTRHTRAPRASVVAGQPALNVADHVQVVVVDVDHFARSR